MAGLPGGLTARGVTGKSGPRAESERPEGSHVPRPVAAGGRGRPLTGSVRLRRARWWVAHVLLATVLAACGGDDRTALVVHTPYPDEVTAAVATAFEEAHPDARVEIVRASDEETLAALERGDVVDVWWGGDANALERAADADRLRTFEPRWAARAEHPSPIRPDVHGRWWGNAISPWVIAFDRGSVTLGDAPTDWVDLFHHQWYDDLVLLDPTRDDDMAGFVAAIIVEALRDDDDLLRGLDWHLRLDASTRSYLPTSEGVLRALAAGEGRLTILPRHVAEAARAGGAELHYRVATSGAPVLLKGVAIGVSAAQPELAEAFVDGMDAGSIATRILVGTGWAPVVGSVDPGSAPPGYPPDLSGSVYAPAPDTLARETEGWIDRWDLEIRGRG